MRERERCNEEQGKGREIRKNNKKYYTEAQGNTYKWMNSDRTGGKIHRIRGKQMEICTNSLGIMKNIDFI